MRSILNYLRLLARCIFVSTLAWSGCLRRVEKHICASGAIVTLTFHRVLDDMSYRATNSLSGMVIRERTFRELAKYVAEHCEPIAFGQAVPSTPSKRIRIALTFDDGWRDIFSTAFPTIRAHKLPATMFVCPGVLGKTSPFWPERAMALLRAAQPRRDKDQFLDEIEALKRQIPEQREQYLAELSEQAPFSLECSPVDKTLSWDEIVQMNKAGISFGSHTDTHQILTSIPSCVAREEMRHSKAILEQMLGKPCDTFAYPNGDCSSDAMRVAKELGFTRAVTTERGLWTSLCHPLSIPRSNVCESGVVGITGRFWPPMFAYTVLWKAWRAHSRATRIVDSEMLLGHQTPGPEHATAVGTTGSLGNR